MGTAIASHRRTWRRVDRFLAVSAFVAELLASTGIPQEQIRVVANSVPDPGPSSPIGDGFLFVGRLDHQKGIRLLLDAWDRSGLGNETVLTIVGDGPERPEVEGAAERVPGIRYVGSARAEQVLEHMQKCRAVVIPPIGFEALPTVVLEAYASGRPVVATKVGPLESMVPNDAGWLATTDPSALAATLTRSWHARDAAQMGVRARELYLERYAPSAVLGALVGVYRDVTTARLGAALAEGDA